MMDELVSIIVPVYKVKQYLNTCIDSIIYQTYDNLEIILVDDGSPDCCGEICDRYALEDDRIQVVHQENRGLSGARNTGLDICKGDYIAFVDSDDWIESSMVEGMLKTLHDYEAQVCCCGYYLEYWNHHTDSSSAQIKCYEGDQILLELMKGTFGEVVWNKLWKAELFKDEIRFPLGVNHEDIEVVWKLLNSCNRLVQMPDMYYHYLQRAGGICQHHTMKNLSNHWDVITRRYKSLSGISEELKLLGIKSCLFSAARIWSWTYATDKKEQIQCREFLQEVNAFVKKHRQYAKTQKWPMSIRVGIFFASYNNRASFFCSYWVNRVHRKLKGYDRLIK